MTYANRMKADLPVVEITTTRDKATDKVFLKFETMDSCLKAEVLEDSYIVREATGPSAKFLLDIARAHAVDAGLSPIS